MSTETTPALETEQAAREATRAHPYGRYLEEFEVGAVYKHWPAKTVTEADDHLFCLLTMNHHPLHLNDVYAAASQQGRNVVVGPLVYSLALGMSVSDVSGKAIANLATEELRHPAPVFHGDTLFAESEVLEVKPSAVQARSRRGPGAYPRLQAGRHARCRVQARGPGAEAGAGRSVAVRREQRRIGSPGGANGDEASVSETMVPTKHEQLLAWVEEVASLHPARRGALVRRIRRGVRRPGPAARRRRDLHAAL